MNALDHLFSCEKRLALAKRDLRAAAEKLSTASDDSELQKLRAFYEAAVPLMIAAESWRVHASIEPMRDMPLTDLDAAIAAYDAVRGEV